MNSPSMADSSGDMQKMVFEAMNDIKSQGVFDQFRRECLADVDTKVGFTDILCIMLLNFISLCF